MNVHYLHSHFLIEKNVCILKPVG